MFYAWTVVLILNHGYFLFFFCISFFYVNMYQYAEQEVENFFFYPIRNFDCCLIYEYDIPYLLCSTIQGRLSRSEFGGGGRRGGKVPAPPPISPFGWKSSWCTGNHWWLEQTPLRQSFPPPENYWISHRFLGKTNKLL